MKTVFEVKEIEAKTTHGVRHAVLRKGRPIESCIFDGDELSSSLHLGAFEGETLVGVLSAYQKKHSAFEEAKAYQVRGVAVLDTYRDSGVGRLLMETVESLLSKRDIPLVWLNARIAAIPFYKKLKYNVYGKAFDVPLIGKHYCYFKYLK